MSKGKILLIDDSEIVRDVAEEILTSGGYQMIWLESPMLLAVTVRKEQPDLVLMDVNMPAVSGDKAMELANQFGTTKNIPVLFHSSRPASELEQLRQKTGADGYIEKGSSATDFLRQIDSWMKVAATRRAKPARVG